MLRVHNLGLSLSQRLLHDPAAATVSVLQAGKWACALQLRCQSSAVKASCPRWRQIVSMCCTSVIDCTELASGGPGLLTAQLSMWCHRCHSLQYRILLCALCMHAH